MRENGVIRIGTSGWHYRHWKGAFYPAGCPAADYLDYYARYFSTVEINSTFYRLPERSTLASWRGAVPPGFVFAAKASRYITEAKKLKDPAKPLGRLFGRIDALDGSLGPVLFQLPPRWRLNYDRLASFITALPAGRRYAFEFRDRSWFTEEVFALLARHACALCVHDYHAMAVPERLTADFSYIRLHGPGRYGKRSLKSRADTIAAWAGRGTDVYCYFNNDRAGYAVLDALDLCALTDARSPAAAGA